MKTFGGVEVKLYKLLNPALQGDEWSASCSAVLPLSKAPIKLPIIQ
jgi:hypothetical protein